MNSWDEAEIRALAHELWLRQGCPEGRGEEHWHEAEAAFREKWLHATSEERHEVRDLRAKASGAH